MIFNLLKLAYKANQEGIFPKEIIEMESRIRIFTKPQINQVSNKTPLMISRMGVTSHIHLVLCRVDEESGKF